MQQSLTILNRFHVCCADAHLLKNVIQMSSEYYIHFSSKICCKRMLPLATAIVTRYTNLVYTNLMVGLIYIGISDHKPNTIKHITHIHQNNI